MPETFLKNLLLLKMRELSTLHNDTAFFMQIAQTRPPETIVTYALC